MMVGHRLFAALTLCLGGVAVQGSDYAETCEAEGTCPGGPGQAALAQPGATMLQAKRKEQGEALEDSGFPASAETELLQLQEQGREHLEAEAPEQWIDLGAAADVSKSQGGQNLASAFDNDLTSFGGATWFVIDLGMQYRITKQQIDWRICKCLLPDAARLLYNDGRGWKHYKSITGMYVWGGMKRMTYEFDVTARYFAIQAFKSPVKYVAFYEVGLYGRPVIPKQNVYGWTRSYVAGTGDLSGTEMIHLVPYKGKLFGGTGYWKNFGSWRPAEVVRLDCNTCDWVVETQISPYAGRTEVLKEITWTTTATGEKLAQPVTKLLAGFYLNWEGEGRCKYTARDDEAKVWHSAVYWKKKPFKSNYFSARALELFQDPVTKIDMLFFVTGMDGIIAGHYDPESPTYAAFPATTESGPVETRPLALTVMDDRIYFSASSYIKRRNNGPDPTWEKVFDMVDHDKESTVDEAVGGIRGLTTLVFKGVPSLFFAWAPNAASEGCMMRLDKDGAGGFKHYKEKCVKDIETIHLGKNKDNLNALVVFSIADYNFALEVSTNVHLIGFQVLLYGYSAVEFPVDNSQEATTASGKRLAYFAGAGYMIRRGPSHYSARTPGGPRYDVTDVFPKQVATRCYANSPFKDNAIYFGGYDCNHFASQNTAWVARATQSAVWARPVPCQKELGCGHVPGVEFKKYGCQFWPEGAEFKPWAVSGFVNNEPISCQTLINYLNGKWASRCAAARHWPSFKRCSEIACDLCAGTGKALAPDTIAGGNRGGGTYSCKTALNFVKTNGVSCTQGQAWWKHACCKSGE